MLSVHRLDYWTVSVSATDCCTEPEVAVTVTVDVVGWWLGPLHPESRLKLNTAAVSSTKGRTPRRLLHPSRQRVNATDCCTEPEVAVTVTVDVVGWWLGPLPPVRC